jgi:pimeloyl-ACP methyl ester carboxylesterase
VPLDRADPASATIAIAFQLTRPHRSSVPAVSAIVISNGGPGVSNIASDPIWRDRLAALLKTHDLLAIDHRGMGQSAAIDCPALQHVQGDQLDAARSCGASLGAASDRYGSGDVADDVDDVRAALGISTIDYYGVSYGGVDVRAYAYRHADHLRAAILDSPDFSTDDAFFRTLPGAMAKIAARVCRRSTACAGGEPHPATRLSQLVRRLRAKPVTGTGYDASGKARRVRVDEQALLGILYDNYFADPAFLNQGEIFAAARALQSGDKTPLLRSPPRATRLATSVIPAARSPSAPTMPCSAPTACSRGTSRRLRRPVARSTRPRSRRCRSRRRRRSRSPPGRGSSRRSRCC